MTSTPASPSTPHRLRQPDQAVTDRQTELAAERKRLLVELTRDALTRPKIDAEITRLEAVNAVNAATAARRRRRLAEPPSEPRPVNRPLVAALVVIAITVLVYVWTITPFPATPLIILAVLVAAGVALASAWQIRQALVSPDSPDPREGPPDRATQIGLAVGLVLIWTFIGALTYATIAMLVIFAVVAFLGLWMILALGVAWGVFKFFWYHD